MDQGRKRPNLWRNSTFLQTCPLLGERPCGGINPHDTCQANPRAGQGRSGQDLQITDGVGIIPRAVVLTRPVLAAILVQGSGFSADDEKPGPWSRLVGFVDCRLGANGWLRFW
jgi:hypothetical protein